eukprot:scaffold178595_cov35-Attheya_sp.AAC.1
MMTFSKAQATIFVALVATTKAFSPAASQAFQQRTFSPLQAVHFPQHEEWNEFSTASSLETLVQPTFDPLPTTFETTMISPPIKKTLPKKKVGAAASHKDGIFSPVVSAAKAVLGDQELNKIRAKAISLHSDVIKSFVETAETPFGQKALVQLFAFADKNHDGKLDEVEVAEALNTLGFSWLQEKQVAGIMTRADADANGVIDFQEFVAEAPKTLKTNLVKLAKKNGGDLGFLV